MLGALALALDTGFGSQSRALAQPAPTPPTVITPSPGPAAPSPLIVIPTTPTPLASTTPFPVTPTSTPAGRRRRGGSDAATATPSAAPSATATPTSPAFSSLDGNWEMQVQRIDTTFYSRFTIKQDGSNVTGTWYADNLIVPISGTYDGRLFHFVVKDPSGNLDWSGYVENSTNMVGVVDNGKGDIPNANPLAFTAEHRGNKPAYPKKQKGSGKG